MTYVMLSAVMLAILLAMIWLTSPKRFRGERCSGYNANGSYCVRPHTNQGYHRRWWHSE